MMIVVIIRIMVTHCVYFIANKIVPNLSTQQQAFTVEITTFKVPQNVKPVFLEYIVRLVLFINI